MNTEKILVAAAVIHRKNSVLICQRPRNKHHGGLWEFPGGKLHSHESMDDALKRELREELDVEVISVGKTLLIQHDLGTDFEVHFIEVEINGVPCAIEHEALEWVPIDKCKHYALAPTDRAFVEECAKSKAFYVVG